MIKADTSMSEPTVFVIDDDEALRQSLIGLFHSIGLQAKAFGSVQEFQHDNLRDAPGCLVLDVRMPGKSGLDLQAELNQSNIRTPIVFISGHADVPMSVRAIKSGAVEFLVKPFREQDLLDAVQGGIDRDREQREKQRADCELRSHYEALTPREQQVCVLVMRGLMSKQIAAKMGISLVTVKVHRGSVMHKMGAKTLADLVRMGESLRLPGTTPLHKGEG
jgi:FixJ family two-component response regulator